MPQVTPPIFELSTLTSLTGFTLNGVSINDWTGSSVSSADVNGDGLSDILIGAWGASPGGRNQAGSVYIVYGTRSGFNTALELSSLNGANGFRLNGVASPDYTGWSVSGTDVNGDGLS